MNENANASERIPISEWIVCVLGVLLVCGSIAFLAYKEFMIDNSRPVFETTIERHEQTADGYVTTVAVKNIGGKSVSDVTVQLTVRDDRAIGFPMNVVIDYLPSSSRKEVGIHTTFMPNLNDVEAVVTSFTIP